MLNLLSNDLIKLQNIMHLNLCIIIDELTKKGLDYL